MSTMELLTLAFVVIILAAPCLWLAQRDIRKGL